MKKVYIIGVNEDGAEGLTELAHEKIRTAETIVGGKRHISLVKELISTDDVITIGADVEKVLDEIEDRLKKGKKVVVLNSGDPLFYGFGKNALLRFGKDVYEVIPNVSSVQLAFSKVKETWEDAKIISIHSKKNPIEKFLYDILENEKICLLTSGKDDPKKIASFLKQNQIEIREFWVLENLGGKSERIRFFTSLDEVEGEEFSSLNIVIILKPRNPRFFEFGLPEKNFMVYRSGPSSSGLITKGEIRAIAISKLRLSEDSVVWDIGGGSGSVSVECAKLARYGKVFCIEKKESFIPMIRENIRRFRLYNVEVVCGEAPYVLDDLPDPHAVFVGGGGEKIEDILLSCFQRLTLMNLVATFVVPSHFTKATEFLKKANIPFEAFMFNMMKLKKINGFDRFEPHTTVFLLHAYRENEREKIKKRNKRMK